MKKTIVLPLFFLLLGVIGAGILQNIEQIKKQEVGKVEQLRKLKYKKDVKSSLMGPGQIKQFLLNDMKKSTPDKELIAGQKLGIKTGIYPKGFNLKQTLLRFVSGAVGGFYYPRTKQLIIKKGLPNHMLSSLMRHELTHALQDQHTDMYKNAIKQQKINADKGYARRCFYEGEAKTIENMGTPMSVQKLRQEMAQVTRMFADIPKAITKPMTWCYIGGTTFLKAGLNRGGWKEIDKIYKDLPASTEQIIHPEKYFTNRDEPVTIKLPKIKKQLSGYKFLAENTSGEFGIIIGLEKFIGERAAKIAAEGWDGDRSIGYEKGDRVMYYIFSTWDSEKDANEYFDAYQNYVKKRYSRANSKEEKPDKCLFDTEEGRVYIEKREKDVVVVDGVKKKTLNKLEKVIWNATKNESKKGKTK